MKLSLDFQLQAMMHSMAASMLTFQAFRQAASQAVILQVYCVLVSTRSHLQVLPSHKEAGCC